MDDPLKIQDFKNHLARQQDISARKRAFSLKTPFCAFHQTHDHDASDCLDLQVDIQTLVARNYQNS